MSLYHYTIKQVEKMLKKKEISAVELAEQSFNQIKLVDDDVKAFLTLDKDNVMERAKELDQKATYDKKLSAIPGAIKDNILTKGIRTTCSSKMLENFHDPLYDATVVEKLKQSESLLIGKVNMDEFAMGSTTETSYYQMTKNPWDLKRVPGGSSGGSAATVAAGEVMYALGSDTGGSIRQPASFCGIVGMKPTYGLVSRYGAIAFAASLDQIGPMTRTVEDNAHILQIIAGHDERDSTSSKRAIPDYSEALIEDVKGLKIAVPKEFIGDGVAPEVKEAVMNALKMYELLGATWEEVSLPHLPYADAVYYAIGMAEASSSLGRFDGIRYGSRSENAENMIDMFKMTRGEGFGEEVKRRILLGTTVLSGEFNEKYFQKAQKVRTLIINDFRAAFEYYDVIMGPTTPTPAYKLGEDRDPLTMYMSDMMTVPINIAGVPALSVPNGYTENGLPMGLQIIGNYFDESTIYRAAYAYERATNHHKKRPDLGGTEE